MTKKYLVLQNKAKKAFIDKKYLECLRYCSLANGIITDSSEEIAPQHLQYSKMLGILADMALEHEDEARSLFEYYQIIKSESPDALEKIIAMVENFDKNLYNLNLALQNIQEADIDKNNGILYKDFEKLVAEVGFKEAFEDLMFSTKIIFTNKGDFLFFMQNLVDYGFKDIAINYFENIGNILFLDKDFLKIYKQILKSGEYQ